MNILEANKTMANHTIHSDTSQHHPLYSDLSIPAFQLYVLDWKNFKCLYLLNESSAIDKIWQVASLLQSLFDTIKISVTRSI